MRRLPPHLTPQQRRDARRMLANMRAAGIDPDAGDDFGERFAGDLLGSGLG